MYCGSPGASVSLSLADLISSWRVQSQELRAWGAESNAQTLERAADQLEAALQEQQDELLTLRQGAEVSGYSEDHLGRLVREGKLTNHGRRNAPRVRRGELPKKGLNGDGHDDRFTIPSKAQIARAVVTSSRGA